jgi:hypothetical protein
MISVRNRRLLLNGSKLLFFILIVFSASCSRKVVPPIKHPDEPGELPRAEQPPVIVLEPRINSIGLILPFYSADINPAAVEEKSVKRADVALEFYQGFKLALDSLAKDGAHFQLEVLDGGDEGLANLARSESVQNKDLLVGPIFPDGIRTFSEFTPLKGKVLVSPLAASSPAQYKNPALVTLTNGIDQHGAKVADFIAKKYQPAQINLILINTRTADAEKFATPLKKQLNTLSAAYQIIEVTNTIGIEKRLSKTKINVVVVASEEQKFVQPTVYRLYRLKTAQKLAVDLFGHPNWNRLNLDINQLQALNTRISSSFHVDYASENVRNFVARYRSTYWEEPSEYAFKGFDTGFYFGTLLEKYGKEYVENIGSSSYHGLHSDFLFTYDGQYGFRNIDLTILQYKDFELKPVQ